MKKIIVSVINDITTDQRVDKISNTLLDLGFEVVLVGRKLKNSKSINRKYKTKRFKLWFNNGPLFYANFNIRLFFFLLFSKFDTLWCNDLDSLPANYYASKIKGKKIIFDSHEYFTEMPELVDRPKVKKIWKTIEKKLLPKLKNITTVSPSIVDLYKKEYDVDVKLLRNVPVLNKKVEKVENIKIEGKKILIYQGAINVNRGIEYMIEAMKYIDNAFLYIIGTGDISHEIKELINSSNLSDKVKMLGEIPLEKLYSYTVQGDLGLSLEEDKGLNYRFALPNKLFDYIHAGLPVLVSFLPEMKKLVEQYKIGKSIQKHDSKHIADCIIKMINDKNSMQKWKESTKIAALELNWDIEKKVIESLL